MQPSLDEAYLRIKRARQHISAVRRHQRQIAIDPEAIIVRPHPNPVDVLPKGRQRYHSPEVTFPPAPPTDPRWAIRLGETIYNLRAALDYLMYALAHLDSGQPQQGTQFPICSSKQKFDEAVDQNSRRCLARCVNIAHLAVIEELQPYSGSGLDPKWLIRLQELSNPDKHRHLTVVQSRPLTVRAWTIGASVGDMKMQVAATRQITLDDPGHTPVIPILDSLLGHVIETLDLFKPDF